jgi:DNA mismatch repair protein MutL
MSSPEVSGRRPIRRLDPDTIARIAAGEVVERPASVVKELVENAADAGAQEVRVRLEGGGLEAIVVDDDGAGIPAEELPLAVERHATSKLEDIRHLARVATLGFRGEALSAIGAVSRLRIISRTAESDAAHGISVVAGAVVGGFVEGRAPGTTVEVRELFFNTPARRKFLRSPAAEQAEVAGTLERLYLARPSIALRLESEHGEIASLPAATRLRDASGRVFGPEFLVESFEVQSTAGPLSISGVLGRPTVSRSNGAGLYLSINGRTVASRSIAQAVRLGFAEYLPRTRYPVGVLSLEIDPERLDVNVHPTKREVRIAREREVDDAVRHAVRAALRGTSHVAERPQATVPAARPLPPSALVPSTDEPLPLDEVLSLASAPARSVQRTLGPPPVGAFVRGTDRHPGVRLIGPIFTLYWLAEGEDALLLIDQHAASERVLFDALRREGRLARQELVDPVRLELGARRAAVLEEHAEDVRRGGFEVEPFGGDSYRVLAVPSYRGRRVPADQLLALLDELGSGGRPAVPDGLAERVDASIACHAAVRAGDPIAPEEMGRILDSLYAVPEASYACPHGRPILVRFPRGRLDQWFLRSSP